MLVRNVSARSPEEGRKILLLMLLRAFWEKNFMEIDVPAFHMAFGRLLLRLKESLPKGEESSVDEFGFVFDRESRRYRLLNELLHQHKDLGFFVFDRHDRLGDNNIIRFTADTGRNVRRALADDYKLEAAENVGLNPLCHEAVGFYNHEMRLKGCE